jgi:hypothetical protein
MSKLIADESLRKQINGAAEPFEICDTEGKVLGHFVPPDFYKWLIYEAAKHPPDLTPEEIQRRLSEGPGRPLAQIWKDLGRS